MKYLSSSRFAATSIAFVLTLLFTANSFAAVDMFLKLEGTNGEGTFQAKIDPWTGDCNMKNVPQGTYKTTLIASPEAFSSHTGDGSSAPSTIEISSFSWGTSNTAVAGTGLSSGKVSMSDLSVMKKTDAASPSFSTKPVGGGFTHKTCVLHVRKAGENPKEYYTIELTKITITGGGEELPKESIEARSAGTPKSAGYDLKANVKI